ncbi:MAG: PocR ligand-binding domain-containing protein [Treponemataceae bacterium]
MVEDESIVAKALEEMLQRLGYETIATTEGQKAVNFVSADPKIDLALIDIDLGAGIDGAEAARKMQTERKIPVVFLIPDVHGELVKKIRDIARYGFIIKDSAPFLFQSSIEMAFELFDSQKQVRKEAGNGSPELKDVINAPLLQSLMNDFYALTGMNIGIIDLSGRNLVATGWQDICARFHRANPLSCAHCTESNAELSKILEDGKIKEYRCKNNMWDVTTPLFIGGKHLGNIKTGQFFYDDETVDYELFRAQAKKFGYDEADYLDALDKVPRWSRERVRQTMRFYRGFAYILGNLSYANIELARALSDRERLLQTVTESDDKLRIIADYTMDWESWFAPDGKYLWVNPGVESVTGYSAEEVLAMKDFVSVMIAEEDREGAMKQMAETARGTRGKNYEFRFIHKNGDIGWLTVSWMPVYDSKGRYLGIRASGRDITDRKTNEEKLARSVEEKEILLRELKHRVKNSLSIVSSLLSLNKDLITDEQASRVFLEAIGRVKSVSAIYEQLNVSESLDRIDIDVYIHSLIEMIDKTFTLGQGKIRFIANLQKIPISLKSAVPIGLILNELITNAIKYAYTGDETGEVRITLERSGNSATLRVADDGRGLPKGFDPERTESLGLRISSMLAVQLGGNLSFEKNKGTTAAVTFRL